MDETRIFKEFIKNPCLINFIRVPFPQSTKTKTPYKSMTYKALVVARTGIEPVLQE